MKDVDFTTRTAGAIDMMRRHGLLLCSADNEGNPNIMTIGWGHIGILWGRPSFSVLVRPSRFTFRNIEANPNFAVCVPGADMKEQCLHCGTVSGRDHEKFRECDFTPAEAQNINVPLIGECNICFECRVVHKTDIVDAHLPPDSRGEFYKSGDLHRVYYGEILRTAARD